MVCKQGLQAQTPILANAATKYYSCNSHSLLHSVPDAGAFGFAPKFMLGMPCQHCPNLKSDPNMPPIAPEGPK